MRECLFLLSVMLSGCVFGATSSRVEHKHKNPDGSERVVAHETSGVGAFVPPEGAGAKEIAQADQMTAAAGQVDQGYRWGTPWGHPYQWDPKQFPPYYAYGNDNPVLVRGQVRLDLSEARRLDEELGPGASYSISPGRLELEAEKPAIRTGRGARTVQDKQQPKRVRQARRVNQYRMHNCSTGIARFQDLQRRYRLLQRENPVSLSKLDATLDEKAEVLRAIQRNCPAFRKQAIKYLVALREQQQKLDRLKRKK